MTKLENESLEAAIRPAGAELVSLKKKTDNTEYMWNADPAFWAKTSPVLFPVVGGLKNGEYHYEGKTYKLGRHGFARDKVFEVEKKSGQAVTFLLTHDQDTLKVYPFEFEFRVTYTLSGNGLTVSYSVFNPAGKDLWFSLGGHPAFRVPLSDDTAYEDYHLEFEKEEYFLKWPLNDAGLVLDQAVRFAPDAAALPLTKSLFYEDALVFKGLRSEQITLKSGRTDKQLKFTFKNFPYFGIWAARDADFVCLEPWCGVADAENHDMELISKEGINRLEPQKEFARHWTVEV